MNHGERYVKKLSVNCGKTVYFKVIRFCVIHGEIDLFVCRDWDALHKDCQNTPTQGAAAEMPKAFAQAA